MMAYIYCADIYCEECASDIRQELTEGPRVECRDDSDHWPQGPYGDGGGEADYPVHCGSCGLFLENPLTTDGQDYVAEALDNYPVAKRNAKVKVWAVFYGFLAA